MNLFSNLLSIIKESTKSVPVMRYAQGIAAIGAVIGLIKAFNIGRANGVLGAIIVIALMTILLVLQKASLNKKSYFNGQGKFLVWSMLVFLDITVLLIISCAFFKYPTALPYQGNKPTWVNRYLYVNGHVYWENNTPIASAVVIPSVNGQAPVLTGQNGGFKFRLLKVAIHDELNLSITSEKFAGPISKVFPKYSLTKDCNIYVPIPDKPLISQSTNPTLKGISPIPKPTPVKPNFNISFITPMRTLLDSNHTNYIYYTKHPTLESAQKLYINDTNMRNLISKNRSQVPVTLNKDVENLTKHLDTWIEAYEKQTRNRQLQPGSTFRVQYNGPAFPVSSVLKIKNYETHN